jgi:hypothetical protein
MSSYKSTSDDYIITVADGQGTLYINGNLNVVGNVTYIDVNELTVEDPFITVAGNNTGNLATATFQSQGLVAQTSANTFAGIRFNNTANAWQVSKDVYANGEPNGQVYVTLAEGGSGLPGGNINEVQINNGSGEFSASANLQFDTSVSRLLVVGQFRLGGHEAFLNVPSTPPQLANATIAYSQPVGAGDTGLYVLATDSGNTVTANDELISLTRARLYSIIF